MFRRLRVSDYDQYLPLLKQFRETDISRERFETFVTTCPSTLEVWVAETEGRLVGTITLLLEPKLIFNACTFAHVEDVCVDAGVRHQGLGTALVTHAIARAKELGCRKLTLDCGEALCPFYAHCGLERRGVQMSTLLFTQDSH
jgi:glucosamine-phosphate N-acetyltransferase